MEFSEFVKILEEFYKGEQSQAKFTKDLFLKIAKDELEFKIENRSDQAFIQYYQGNRSIKPIAKIIHYELDKTKFKNYLAQREKNTDAKKKLCNAFRGCAPKINMKNLFNKIAKIFVDIINDACNESDGRSKKQPADDEAVSAIKTVESDEQSVDDEVVSEIDDVESGENYESLFSNLNISKEDISELKTLAKNISNKIYVLLDIGNKINNKANEMGFNIPAIVNPGLYNALDKNYEAFHDFKYDLRRYNSKYPNKLFDRAIDIFLLLKANSFVEYYSPFFDSNSLISELQETFIQILDELKKL